MNKLIEPNKNCSKCRRLYNFRKKNQSNNPDWFNAPVPTFGELSSSLLIFLRVNMRGQLMIVLN